MTAYLDNAATTQPCPEAAQAALNAISEVWGNPSSLHRLGDQASAMLSDARRSVAQALGGEPDRLFFTSGGTEADNWAIFSAAQRMGKRGRHIVTTAVEHHAVLHPIAQLEAQGFTVTYLQPDRDGCIDLSQLQQALRKDTVFVSIMMVNNETGAVMPIEKMARLTHRLCPDALFHTDAVQGFLKLPFRARSLGADLISISGHKVHGIKGAGALYIRKGLNLPPYQHGGGQETGLRSGTEPLPAIAAFGAACDAAMPTLREDLQRESALRDRLRKQLEQLPGVTLLGAAQAPHIVSCAIEGVPSQNTINMLQEHGCFVSAGSACSKGHRSHVFSACGLAPGVIDGSIRFSLSRFTTEAQIDLAAEAMADVLRRMRR